jgi:hypothetical protein
MSRRKQSTMKYVSFLTVALFLTVLTKQGNAYDVNGDGQEGLAESIHALQTVAGMLPFTSRIMYVGPVGTALENGNALLNTLTSITDASSSKPYLIKLEPGIYDLGTQGLQMLEYVDLEGSGERTTTITSTHSGSDLSLSATLYGANYSELRFLTIENKGSGANSIAIYNENASPDITKVTIKASGGTTTYGIYNSYSFSKLTHLSIKVTGGADNYGIYNVHSPTVITNTDITASGGFNSHGMYEGNDSGSTISDFKMVISGAYGSYGMNTYSNRNPDHSLTINNLTLSSTASAIAYGMRHDGCTSIDLNNSVVKAFGGSTKNTGVYVNSSCVLEMNGTKILIGGTNDDGEQPNGTGFDNGVSTVIMKNSSISALSGSPRIQAIWSGSGEVKIISTLLEGYLHGDLTCVGAYDQAFVARNANCSN